MKVLSGAFDQYTTSTSIIISYEARYTDGSYVKAATTANRDSSDVLSDPSVFIDVTWSDGWCDAYSATVGIIENTIGYLLNGTTLTIVSDNTTISTDLTDIEKASITEIVAVDSVKSIGKIVFKNYPALTSVTIGNSITSIGKDAFLDCHSLESITIGSSVTSIGERAFYNCSSLANVYYNGTASQWASISFGSDGSPMFLTVNLFLNGKLPVDITLENITTINEGAFFNCSSLTNITISDSVTSIGNRAFSGCTALASVVIGSGVTSIGSNAFNNCTSLTSVTLKNTSGWYVTEIMYYNYLSGIIISSDDLANTVTAASYLENIYKNYYWYWSKNL